MSGVFSFNFNRTGRAGELWPVLLLLIVVAVPTIGVLWFVSVAMQNQQLATRQRLTNAYQSHLENVRQQIDIDWKEVAGEADALVGDYPQGVFADVVAFGIVDSVICYDDNGQVQYPSVTDGLEADDEDDPRWLDAKRVEHELADPRTAEGIYESIATDTKAEGERIMAIQAQLRCLLKAGDEDAAVQLVVQSLADDRLDALQDAHARSVAANIQLMAIEHISRTDDYGRILASLWNRVHNYGKTSLSSAQRLFLMKRLAEIAPDRVDQRMLEAEDLAARFVVAHPNPSRSQPLQPSQLPNVWQAATPSGRRVLLLNQQAVIKCAKTAAAKTSLPPGADVHVMSPAEEPPVSAFLSLPAGASLPGWRLALSLADGQQIDSTTIQRNRLHLWTGSLVVLFTSILALFIVRAFRRQIRLANLKNDLAGTVSHELKTPLSSMRLLVDTLLDEEHLDEQTTREYLQLIAKENTRLSRLIENFLAFTRMEQNRHVFQFRNLPPAELVADAVEAAGERFHADDCSLKIDVDENLPAIHGDKDGLVTVLLNLLDNAYKYSNGPRDIAVRATAQDGSVCLSVSDNGVGLPRTATRRVFQRFYQVDQSLAREGRGCGLGLSIVDSIVRAHRGTVSVVSSLGKGSTFAVKLPVAPDQPPPTEASV